MNMNNLEQIVLRLIKKLDELIPQYRKIPEDQSIANGNVAVCIIDEGGGIYGKMFVASSKIRTRECFRIAWIKASQVWLTGMKTGEYEKKVYSGEISETVSGISKPDFIGWEGGQPISLHDGSNLSIGFSGFRGQTDIEIVQKAVAMIDITS
jgi:uncharacterized protein GlcG (DUF336 family)